MKDLTQGSVAGHLISMALPTAASMLFQTLYLFVDLYFVAELGDAAVAGVTAAGNIILVIASLMQVLSVGTVALISNAVGRNDEQGANLIFNQSLLIAASFGALALLLGHTVATPYLRSVTADEATAAQGVEYLLWFVPGLAFQFVLISMTSAQRGQGIVKPGMVVQIATVLLNIALAPVLIVGWGTGYAMGSAGAGLASSIAIFIGVVLFGLHFNRVKKYVTFRPEQWWARWAVWKRILTIGLPAGGEFLLVFAYLSITFWAISDFGPATQAGFGIGSRVMAGIFLPVVAIGIAVAPLAGQNFGARRMDRVRETLRVAYIQSMALMAAAVFVCQWQPEVLVRAFSREPEVVQVGALFLRLISWNFVLNSVTFICSGVFQALGNTGPLLWGSAIRVVAYAVPMLWLTSQPGYRLEHVWYLAIAATALQAGVNVVWLRRQMRLQLGSPAERQATSITCCK